jgi:glycosyltransferase involved in cell wall biosynthesis
MGGDRFSLCGITHTIASSAAMDSICAWPMAPIYDWDACICTSQVVKDSVNLLLEKQQEYLSIRTNTNIELNLPELPVIPLGVSCKQFKFTERNKSAARANLGILPNITVILFAGRLSFHAKAHPLAMYQALGQISKRHSIALIECGWHANEPIAQAYEEAFQVVCPQVRRIVLDGRNPELRQLGWASADIFCSLSDNIQETFGLTPIEAMAAGLPSVVSDWNGYKDTVRDGVDGYRIPSYQPAPGLGDSIARRFELSGLNYDLYCGLTSQLIAVDVKAATQALERLVTDPSLRATMGEAARVRACSVFDWAKIIPRYESLWTELKSRRMSYQKYSGIMKPIQRPARLDPFTIFAGYPTASIDQDSQLILLNVSEQSIGALVERLDVFKSLKMVDFTREIHLTKEDCHRLFQFLSDGPKTVGQILALTPKDSQSQLHLSLLWLMKLGFLAIT